MLEELREKALSLPLKPGVYIMMDAAGEVIYVGKAKKLKNRVSSYFHGSHNAKTEAMISKIASFDTIVAGSEFEALVLENSLIKHHMPKYNILLKDDKGYPFIRVDMASEYPSFSIVSRTAKDGALYFGPYGGRSSTKAAIEAVCKALRLPTCGKKFPRDIGKERPCLNYHMGACDAFCRKDASAAEYRKRMEEAVMVLDGKTDSLIQSLRTEMEQAAEALQFEKAAQLRDAVRNLTSLNTKQYVWSTAMADTDAVGFYRGTGRSCFTVLHYIGGKLLDKDQEILDNPLEDDDEAVSALLRQYYSLRGSVPRSVLLARPCADAEHLERYLETVAGRRVSVSVPARGERLRWARAAELNAVEEMERVTTREERITKTAAWLQKALELPQPPDRIESFDISNTGAADVVASMVVFQGGRPLKRDYRRFKMKTVQGQDDFHSMQEAVSRRFARYQSGDEKFSVLPDLLLIDGGAVHASIARDVVREAGLQIPVYGMVKDDRHRTRALITPEGQEIGIAAQPSVFAFIGSIQEETHRFAIEYHKSLHTRSSVRSGLDEIPGVGPTRRAALLKAFGSLKAVKAAGEEELARVVPRNVAAAVYAAFHKESGA